MICLAITGTYLSLTGEGQESLRHRLGDSDWAVVALLTINVMKCLVITDLYNYTTLILIPNTTTAQTNINTDFSLDVIITTYNDMKIVSMKLSSYFIMFIFNQ